MRSASSFVMRIAVTGGAGEGKSTVLAYCKSAGISTLSSDEVAASIFGEQRMQADLSSLLNVAGPVGRDELRAELLSRPEVRRSVNTLFHKAIARAILASSAIVVEVPLLLEVALNDRFDRVWVVSCGPEEQARRLALRLGRSEDAAALVASQLNSNVKAAFADVIIRTNQPEATVQRYVSAELEREKLLSIG